MAITIVFIYFFLLTSFGLLFCDKNKKEVGGLTLALTGFVAGSAIAAMTLFMAVTLRVIYPAPVAIFLGTIAFLGLFSCRRLIGILKEGWLFLNLKFRNFSKPTQAVPAILLAAGIVVLFLSAATPARDGDAMKYHLAQMKETVQSGGFAFHPYYHYNFPQYFHYLSLPLFMALGGEAVKLAAFLYFLISMIVTAGLMEKLKNVKNHLLVILGITFAPVTILTATVAGNDWAVICYSLIGLYLILCCRESWRPSLLCFAYGAFGLALGSKYQAVLYFPFFWLLTFQALKAKSLGTRCGWSLCLSLLALAVASPFYWRNWHYLGNPVWPMLVSLFPNDGSYVYQMADNFSKGLGGASHAPAYMAKSVINLVLLDTLVPAPFWFLWIGACLARSDWNLWMKRGSLIYMGIWAVLQPALYDRFAVYLLPLMVIMGVAFLESIKDRWPLAARGFYGLFWITIAGGIGVATLYCADFVSYHFHHDKQRYHQATWFYEEYQWINKNIPKEKVVLVIVNTEQTFYLDAPYLIGDPALSGLIDWRCFSSVNEMVDKLKSMGVSYLFYQDMDWSGYTGGDNMMKLMKELKTHNGAKTIFEREIKISKTRMLKRYGVGKVSLIELPDK